MAYAILTLYKSRYLHRFFFVAMSLWLSLPLLRAAEHWTLHEVVFGGRTVRGKAVAAFKGQIYLSAMKEVETGTSTVAGIGLLRSSDAVRWEQIPIDPPVYFTSFVEKDGRLFGFGQILSQGIVTDRRHVFATSDGSSWRLIDDIEPLSFWEFGNWTDSIGFQDKLYASDTRGYLFRSGSDIGYTQWEHLETPFTYCDTCFFFLSMAVFQDYMYLAGCQLLERGGIYTAIYRTRDPSRRENWEAVSDFSMSEELYRPGFVVHNGILYWGANKLWSTSGGNNPITWRNMVVGVLPSPFMVNNELHVVGPSAQILKFSQNTNWENVFQANPTCATLAPVYGRTASLGPATFILPCNLMSITPGIFAVNNDGFLPAPLSAGQTRATVLAFSVKSNFHEEMHIMVRNIGTAIAERDIKSVNLLQLPNPQEQRPNETVIGMVPSLDGKSWSTVNRIPIRDGDKFFVIVDISDRPMDGATCRFLIQPNEFQFHVRSGFQPSSVVASSEDQKIRANPPSAPNLEPIEKVLVYPSPARDTVRFQYTLSSPSNVYIEIYDREGSLISEVKDLNKAADLRSVSIWDASQKAPGIYYALIKIKTDSGEERVIKSKVIIER